MEDKKPLNSIKISVIIPVYNTEKYLRECLDSVAGQTLRETEIICVDDGSTDNSLAILQDYGRKDNRFILLFQKNKGAGAARNAGLNIAKGEYLAILDSDDIYDTTMLEKMYRRSEELQTDITACFVKSFDNKTKRSWDFLYTARKIKKEVFSYKDTISKEQNFDFFMGWAWDKLFRKSFIDNYGFRFQEISHSNDAFFVFMAMYSAKRITILRESLVKHRVNRDDSIASTHDINPLCFFEMQKAVKDGLIKSGIFSEVKERYFKWAFGHSLWVLERVKSSSTFLEIYSVLQHNILAENDIRCLPVEVLGKGRHAELKKIMSLSPVDYLFTQRNSFRDERDKAKEEKDGIKNEYNQLEDSISCRFGHKLVWFPGKVHGFFKCLKENGFVYTFKHLAGKCLQNNW